MCANDNFNKKAHRLVGLREALYSHVKEIKRDSTNAICTRLEVAYAVI